MRLYSDRPDILTWGRWRRCPPGAIQAPPSWFFARRNFLQFKDYMPLGEVYQEKYGYTKGRGSKRYTGKHYCGTTAWTQGIKYADRPGLVLDTTGVPLCCQANPPAVGGAVCNGVGVWPGVYFPLVGGNVCECETQKGGIALVFP